MADTPAPKPSGGGGTFGFLGKKVFGKVPVWVIAVGAVGGYYWYTHYGPGKKKAGQQQQTDPAGNTGIIDPATGFVYGSAEDLAAIQAGNQQGSGSDLTGPPGAPGPAGPTGPAGPPAPEDERVRVPLPRIVPPRRPPSPRRPPPPPVRNRRPPRPPPWRPRIRPGAPEIPAPRPVYAPGTTGSVYAST